MCLNLKLVLVALKASVFPNCIGYCSRLSSITVVHRVMPKESDIDMKFKRQALKIFICPVQSSFFLPNSKKSDEKGLFLLLQSFHLLYNGGLGDGPDKTKIDMKCLKHCMLGKGSEKKTYFLWSFANPGGGGSASVVKKPYCFF